MIYWTYLSAQKIYMIILSTSILKCGSMSSKKPDDSEMESIDCALCNSSNYHTILTGCDYKIPSEHKYNLVKCKKCGLIYLNPRPTKEVMDRFYLKEYFDTEKQSLNKIVAALGRQLQDNRARRVVKIKKVGKVLDIGCGKGGFMYSLKRRNWDVCGLDPSSSPIKLIRDGLKNRVFNCELKDCHFEDKYFDVITLWHVFEHLPNPMDELREIHRILKDDGIMILTIPNINSVQFRLFKEKCFHLDIPRHLYHYSMETIEKMLSKARFRAANIKHLSFEFLSLEFLRGPYKTLVKLFREKGSPKLVCNFLAIMVTPLTSFLSIANSLLGNGEIMDVYCAKARNIKR